MQRHFVYAVSGAARADRNKRCAVRLNNAMRGCDYVRQDAAIASVWSIVLWWGSIRPFEDALITSQSSEKLGGVLWGLEIRKKC